jgi:beta-glucosidase
MTLFHWDLPQWAEDRCKGWESIDCAKFFADYAACMAKNVGDQLAGVFTMNEFACFLDKGYTKSDEIFAPGKIVSRKVLNQSRHHALYAHGLAVGAFREMSPKAPIGLAENVPCTVPILETDQDILAARSAMRELTGMYLTPILEGEYHPAYLASQGADAPNFTDEQMKVISTPLDFVGINLYAPIYVRHDPSAPRGWSTVPCDDNYPRMHMPWLLLGPSILYWGPRLVCDNWKVPAVYITENGCACPDQRDNGNEIQDVARVMYLQQHLIHLHRAADEGYPVKGYFLWSLMDNFEWACGYTRRFGICYVDYETLERIPKLSARFYADVIQRNAIG